MMPPETEPVKKVRGEHASLSELEGAVLGLIERQGPMTAYAVRKTFLESPTDHFSGSAGAIYPLLRRLEASGLLSTAARSDGRRGVAYSLTPGGVGSLRAWVLPEDLSWMASVTFDPLRTRVLSLGLLEPSERERFLRGAERELSRRASEQSAALDSDDPWTTAACRGALEVTRARLRWIRDLLRRATEAV